MIDVIEGLKGGGKTYFAITRAIKYLASGGVLLTNIPIHWQEMKNYIRSVYRFECSDSQLIIIDHRQMRELYKYVPVGEKTFYSLAILDEAHLAYNARDWSTQSRDLLDWFTLSEHYKVDIILISQHPDNVDKQIRRLVQNFWHLKDMRRVNILGFSVPQWFHLIYCTQWDHTHKIVLSCKPMKGDSSIYALYDRWCEQREFPALNRGPCKAGQKLRRRPMGKLALITCVCIVLGVIYTGGPARILNRMGLGRGSQAVAAEVSTTAATITKQPAAYAAMQKPTTPPVWQWKGQFRNGSNITALTSTGLYTLGKVTDPDGLCVHLSVGRIICINKAGVITTHEDKSVMTMPTEFRPRAARPAQQQPAAAQRRPATNTVRVANARILAEEAMPDGTRQPCPPTHLE